MMNPMNLYDTVKKNALDKLKTLYPDGKPIYEHWQRCLSAYRCGYWTAPDKIDDVWRDCEPGKLGTWLSLYNSSIRHGYCRDWERMIFRYFAEPQYYVFLELIMACSQVTDSELLYNAKREIGSGKQFVVNQPTMDSYEIDEDTLRKWYDEIEPDKKHPYYVTAEDRENDAIGTIAAHHNPYDLQQFEYCSEAMQLFEEGYIAGIEDCALNWKNTYVTDEILDELKHLNNLLREGIPISGLRNIILPELPDDVRPFFTLILDAAEAEHSREEAEKNI